MDLRTGGAQAVHPEGEEDRRLILLDRAHLRGDRGPAGLVDGRRVLLEQVVRNILAIAEESAWSARSWRAVDSRFHLAVAEASGNPFFVDAVYQTRTALFGWYDSFYSRVPWETLPIQDRDIGYFHRPIAEAISRRDPESAGNHMSAALEWSERDLIDLLDGFVAEATAGRERPESQDERPRPSLG